MPREIPRRLLLHHGRIGENRGEIGKHVPGREDGRGLAAPGAPVAPSPASILKEMKRGYVRAFPAQPWPKTW